MPDPRNSRKFKDLLQCLSEEHEREVAHLHAENDRLRQASQALQAYTLPDPQKNQPCETCSALSCQGPPSEPTSTYLRDNTTASSSIHPESGTLPTVPAVHDHLQEGNGTYTSLRHVTLTSPRGEPDIAALNAAYAVATIAEEEDGEFLDTDIVDPNGFDKPLQLPPEYKGSHVAPMRPVGGSPAKQFSQGMSPPPVALRTTAHKVDVPTIDLNRCYASTNSCPIPKVRSLESENDVSVDARPFQTPLDKWRELIHVAQERITPQIDGLCELDPAWVEASNLAIDKSTVPLAGLGRASTAVPRLTRGFTGMSLGGRPKLSAGQTRDLDQFMKGSIRPTLSKQRSKLGSLVDREVRPKRCICKKPKLQLLHPNSRTRVLWDVICLGLLAHDLIMIPMQVFEQGTAGMPQGYDDFTRIFDLVSACFWTGDMIVSFFTGYFTSEGFLELRFNKVTQHYLQSWFLLDLIIVLADWTTIGIGLGSTSGYLRLGKTVSRVMRVLRLLRFMKLNTSMKEIFERINSEYVLTLAGLVRLVVYIVITSHYIACGWYALSQAGNQDRNWAKKFLNHTDSLGYAYSTALHWSLTQFTPASMEVVPQNEYERFFNSFVIIIAMVTFSSFVSSITSAMTHIRNINARSMQQDSMIRQYFNENKVTHQLASRIWHFLRKNRIQNAKFLREEDIPVLKVLPERIRDELRLEVYMPLLVNHPVFAIYYNLDDRPMRVICKRALVHRTLNTHEELFSEEALGHGNVKYMFFVASGSLYYNRSQDPNENLHITRGHWACEVALWGARACLDGPFVASTGGCDLIMIGGTEFQAITKQHPESVGFLVKYAQLFIDGFNQALHDPDCENVLFDKFEVVHWMAMEAYDSGGYAVRPLGSKMGKDVIIRTLFDVPFRRISSMGSSDDTSVDFSEARKSDGTGGTQQSLL